MSIDINQIQQDFIQELKQLQDKSSSDVIMHAGAIAGVNEFVQRLMDAAKFTKEEPSNAAPEAPSNDSQPKS